MKNHQLDHLCQAAAYHDLDVTLTTRPTGAELGLTVSAAARRRGVPSLRRVARLPEITGAQIARAAEALRADLATSPPAGRGGRASGGRS